MRPEIERLTRDLELQDGGGAAYTCQDTLYTVVVQGEDLRAALSRIGTLEGTLQAVRAAIMEHAPDTLWVDLIETAVDRIDADLDGTEVPTFAA